MVETRGYDAVTAQTLGGLCQTARSAYPPGCGGEIGLSQMPPRVPIRTGRTAPEPFQMSGSS